MSSVLPFDIIVLIIDIVGENKDTNLLKELALVSHSFNQICSKHLFATVELRQSSTSIPIRHSALRLASSKKRFVKLLKSRPNVVDYIRKLTYKVGDYYLSTPLPADCPSFDHEDRLLSPILPNFLRKISRLNCLTITGSMLDWNTLDSSLTSAFLYLMRLPTINHIDLSFIRNFPLSGLTQSVNLRRLDIFHLSNSHGEDGSFEIVQSEITPKIREFHAIDSSLLTTKLLHAKRQDGQPAFNFMDLTRLSTSFEPDDKRNVRYLLQNSNLSDKLHISVGPEKSLVGLHDFLSSNARALKVLDLTVSLYSVFSPPLGGLWEELKAMAGHNVLEALSIEIQIGGHEKEKFMGYVIRKVEKALVKPGWSALRRVSFKVSIACCLVVSREDSAKLSEALQSLPDKYLRRLPKLKSVTFNYSAYIDKCVEHD